MNRDVYNAEYGPLLEPVSSIAGVSARRASLLAKLDIRTVLDLLTAYPRAYEDWTRLTPVSELQTGQVQVFRATVSRTPAVQRRGRQSIVRNVLRDEGGAINAIWFNAPWVADQLSKGDLAVFRGKVDEHGLNQQVANPSFAVLADDDDLTTQYLHPIYPLTAGLTQGVRRKLSLNCVNQYAEQMPEALPADIRRDNQLAEIAWSVREMHQPRDYTALGIARRRLAFEELFMLHTGLSLLRSHDDRQSTAIPVRLDDEQEREWAQVKASLPFELTKSQEQVLAEINTDLQAARPMNRLIQGDVGSGKTVVAALAMLRALLAGQQAALMAPTAILAQQHYGKLSKFFVRSGYTPALLTGQTPAAEKRRITQAIAAGDIDCVIGTHALLEDRVAFKRLALTVTDEQHRFGVRQRMKLSEHENSDPHVLVMSATPIPRTLGLVLYGDMDVSRITGLPPGRQVVATYTVRTQDEARYQKLMAQTAARGEQVYVVCPLISPAEDKDEDGPLTDSRGRSLAADRQEIDLASAEETYSRYQSVFPDLTIGLLHGRLAERDKIDIMGRFAAGEIDILVSTTVIEVGVDVPNATMMLILNAERFGLATLHQLRGRIGRGTEASLCVLQSDVGEGLARDRLRALCYNNDGFVIAEEDMRLRGPGDFFGTRQHGLPQLQVANLYEDSDLIEETKAVSDRLLADDPTLSAKENRRIRPALSQRFGLSLAQLGL